MSETRTDDLRTADVAGSAAGAPRELRPYVYAGLDFLFAALYAVALLWLAPSRHVWVEAMAAGLVVAAVAMGAAVLVRRPWAFWVCAAGCGALLALAIALLVLLVMSAAFLAGVYGSLGRAASVFTLIAAALVIEFVALLPAFQLKFALTRAGQRWFGRAPR